MSAAQSTLGPRASSERAAKKEALARELLGRIADKWTLFVIDALEGQGATRFATLRRRVGVVRRNRRK